MKLAQDKVNIAQVSEQMAERPSKRQRLADEQNELDEQIFRQSPQSHNPSVPPTRPVAQDLNINCDGNAVDGTSHEDVNSTSQNIAAQRG